MLMLAELSKLLDLARYYPNALQLDPVLFQQRNKQKSTGVENMATNVRRTRNAAQDMLDLFPGPLLQKPPDDEQETGAIKTESMNITCEDDKQATSREMWREEATLPKEKSSLKDEVAMFLD
ncbi:hypothetical protein COCNU_10G010400 [Cocos nucifera]|uniref:Uncharacterized protein n=1 Tax=Cocos nucifera TaxID=13894 RepID=A0A8K0IMY0_COCNU|nr:hypothetical protein COCNU_10G010400 [Cocos nucifera]